ncbi:hypothetical protein [Microbacterium enclense]|uniref:hypothetical protein n=1 Tax=Microbacterium enclense TaxID=993073 RepID=UPI00341B5774
MADDDIILARADLLSSIRAATATYEAPLVLTILSGRLDLHSASGMTTAPSSGPFFIGGGGASYDFEGEQPRSLVVDCRVVGHDSVHAAAGPGAGHRRSRRPPRRTIPSTRGTGKRDAQRPPVGERRGKNRGVRWMIGETRGGVRAPQPSIERGDDAGNVRVRASSHRRCNSNNALSSPGSVPASVRGTVTAVSASCAPTRSVQFVASPSKLTGKSTTSVRC